MITTAVISGRHGALQTHPRRAATGAAVRAPVPYRRPRAAFLLFTLLLLLGCYLDLGLAIVGFPMLSALPAILIGMILYSHRFFSAKAVLAYGIAIGIYCWSLLAPSVDQFIIQRSLALAQFVYGITVGLVLFWTITRYNRAAISRFLNIFIVLYLVLLALEVFTPFSRVIDTYQSLVFGQDDKFVSIVSNRDQGSVGFGFRRPKLFLPETSHVAMTFAFLLGIKAFLDPSPRLLSNISMGVLGFLLIRSPIAAVGLVFVGFAIPINLTRRSKASLRFVALTLFGIVAIGLVGALEVFVFAGRVASAQSGADYSTTFRTYGSLYAGLATAGEFPFFGVGIGSVDLAENPITRTFLALHIPPEVVMNEWRRQIQNLPAALLVYLGWFGTLLTGASVIAYWRYLSGKLNYFFWALFILEAFTWSAFYSPRFYVYLYVFLAVNFIYNRDERAIRVANGEGVGKSNVQLELEVPGAPKYIRPADIAPSGVGGASNASSGSDVGGSGS